MKGELVEAGAARADITPDLSRKGVRLAGYQARGKALATGIWDRLYARALFLRKGGSFLILVSCDLLWISQQIRDKVLDAVRMTYPIGARELLICATHTHSGPAGLIDHPIPQELFGPYDREVEEGVCQGIVEAIQRAADNLRPARIAFASCQGNGYTLNRRDPHKSGDPEILLIELVDLQDHPIALITVFAAHPTLLGPDNLSISADFPGYFCQELERLVTEPAEVIFCNGAQGDQIIRPDLFRQEEPLHRCQQLGKALANQVWQMSQEISPEPLETIASFLFYQYLPPATNKLLRITHAPLQGLRLNEALLLGIPGEMLATLGKEIKEEIRKEGFKEAAILGLANSYIGYILPPSEYRAGGYEAHLSFFGPELPTYLRRGIREIIKALRPSEG